MGAPTLGAIPLIPRELLFGNPERLSPRISPDGKKLGWIAPDEQNRLQVFVKTLGLQDDRQITQDPKRGIRSFFWAETSETILYPQDRDGDEDWHLHGADLATGNVRDYTAFQGVQCHVLGTDPKHRDEVLVSLNLRDRSFHDVHRISLRTGAVSLDTENPGDVMAFWQDARFRVRAAQVMTEDGGTEIRIRRDVKSPWEVLLRAGPDEIVQFLAFTKDGKSAHLLSSIGTDTARVVRRNLETGAEKVVAESPYSDVDTVMLHPTRYHVEAVAFDPGRREWIVVDPAVRSDFEALRALHDGDFEIVSRDEADRVWLVAYVVDDGPVHYYSWDRASQRGTFLFVNRPKLLGLPLAPMESLTIRSRDGFELPSYLTLPTGAPAHGLPLVLFVHGGPWARDQWGFQPTVQWFANRGYACLQVNYRGSTGFGKRFLNAGNKEWGGRMHDDLVDAVDWAVARGFADRGRVAIYGGSYGGYAVLAGLTFTPDLFACGVDIVGPSNLRTMIESNPPYWKPLRAMDDVRVGNIDDPADAPLLRERSPLFFADRIVRPLLIGHGANDPRVKEAESEQIVCAIDATGGQVTYVLYTDEGHGFARPENRLDFQARAERFLAAHLGGRYEPLEAERHPGATAVVRDVGNRRASAAV